LFFGGTPLSGALAMVWPACSVTFLREAQKGVDNQLTTIGRQI